MKNITVILFILVFLSPASSGAGQTVLFRDEFVSLANWEPFYFPRIARHSTYVIERHETEHYLRAESNASASAIVFRTSFNIYEFPRLRWRWKVRNLYAKADVRKKEGDDYPLRIFVMFAYDPARAGTLERLRYGIARTLYGEYPPHSSLSYVWAGGHEERGIVVTSPFTGKAKIVLVETGAEKLGTWQDEEVNVLDDYRKAFGADPPATARIAIMNDADNTRESSVSYLSCIEVIRETR